VFIKCSGSTFYWASRLSTEATWQIVKIKDASPTIFAVSDSLQYSVSRNCTGERTTISLYRFGESTPIKASDSRTECSRVPAGRSPLGPHG
jgi:hypothetical protein